MEQLRFVLLNARSIVNKIAELEELLFEYDPHVMAITETWLTDHITDAEIVPPTHRIIRRDRGSKGGGVALIVRNDVTCVILETGLDHESLWCRVKLREFSTLIGVVYRPPTADESFMLELRQHLQKLYKPGLRVILAGDFNLPGIDWNDLSTIASDVSSANMLLELMFDFDLLQTVREPTRVCATTQSVLDLVFVNGCIGKYNVTVAEGVSDHKLVFLTFELSRCKMEESVSHVSDFSAADDEAILDYLDLCLSNFDEAQDVQLLWDRFKSIVQTCLSKYVPKKRKKTQRENPWVTRHIIHLKRAITRRRKANTTPTDVLSSLTRTLRQQLRKSRDYFFSTTLVNFMTEAPHKILESFIGKSCTNNSNSN